MNLSSLDTFSTNTATGSNIFSIKKELDGEKEAQFIAREQFIGLLVKGEEFLLDVPLIHEIIMLPTITYVPNSPKFVEGVINLRGNIVPAINLRKMMGFERGAPTSSCRVIITKVNGELVGLIVDGITYVISLLPQEIEAQSLSSKTPSAEIINRVAKVHDRVLGVFDLAKIMGNFKFESDDDEEAGL